MSNQATVPGEAPPPYPGMAMAGTTENPFSAGVGVGDDPTPIINQHENVRVPDLDDDEGNEDEDAPDEGKDAENATEFAIHSPLGPATEGGTKKTGTVQEQAMTMMLKMTEMMAQMQERIEQQSRRFEVLERERMEKTDKREDRLKGTTTRTSTLRRSSTARSGQNGVKISRDSWRDAITDG